MPSRVKSSGKAKRRTRAEWFAIFTADRERGLTGTQIARRRGVGHSFVYDVLNDPTGAKVRERKARYGGTCEDCGTRTYGGDGASKAPTVCADCSAQRQHDSRYWTPARIIAAIRAFHAKHGRPPHATEWNTAGLNGEPYVSVVQREFGSWRAAILAAGFVSHPPGHYERTEETLARMRAAQSAAGIEWTRERVIACIRAWARAHGGIPPSQDDWDHGTEEHPFYRTAANRFGSWNAAIEAAGFTPLAQGQQRSKVGA
jgi:hypothetical protein